MFTLMQGKFLHSQQLCQYCVALHPLYVDDNDGIFFLFIYLALKIDSFKIVSELSTSSFRGLKSNLNIRTYTIKMTIEFKCTSTKPYWSRNSLNMIRYTLNDQGKLHNSTNIIRIMDPLIHKSYPPS